ncbi:MAG: Asp-tRNA(Asn)/Glu-tRNA(Gln) amidotransferase subunit GatA [Deltaproteobacteria bacterium]|nr:Asp-tRNA(Asn)/Glu-tRNA(Gln) amidotransferase subunit GatA [Deltaproteobacteria bacterium]
MELCDYQAAELARLLRKREISSREITESALLRIENKDKTLNAFLTVTPEFALKQADAADKKFKEGRDISPVTGIPVAIKDNLCTKGIRTTCASKILEHYIPPYDATVVKKILQKGAVLIGKTNMDEFAMGSSTENSAFGPTRNPRDIKRVPGGSSGGSACAVASGEAVLAIGSDTGGSIRQPASFCGVTGMKPTYGRVSRYGLVSYASSLDQIGPIGRSVEDCTMLMDVIAGYDKRDTTSINVPKPDFSGSLSSDINGLRIGLPKEYFVEGLDPLVKEKVIDAVNLLGSHGAEIIEISLPRTPFAVGAYYLIATAEASSNLARYDGVKYGLRAERDQSGLEEMYEYTRSEGFGKEVKRRIMLGCYVLSAGYYDAYYLKAQKARTLIKDDFDRAFQDVDCIITPTSPSTAFEIGEKSDDPIKMYLVDIYTVSLNLSGLPGMSVNCGTIDGLPVGLQIIGKPFDEETLFCAGHAYQQIAERK